MDGTGGNARERLPVLETMCVGSGQGMAMVLERLN
jgi:acetyl-CoA acetyltransferase